jgi:hypothetical protein
LNNVPIARLKMKPTTERFSVSDATFELPRIIIRNQKDINKRGGGT